MKYVLDSDVDFIYLDPICKETLSLSQIPESVNILERFFEQRRTVIYKVQLVFEDGHTLVGYLRSAGLDRHPIRIENADDLLDGRFNVE